MVVPLTHELKDLSSVPRFDFVLGNLEHVFVAGELYQLAAFYQCVLVLRGIYSEVSFSSKSF